MMLVKLKWIGIEIKPIREATFYIYRGVGVTRTTGVIRTGSRRFPSSGLPQHPCMILIGGFSFRSNSLFKIELTQEGLRLSVRIRIEING